MAAELKLERTLILVKPDGVQRGLVGKILVRFEERGLKLAGMKMVQAPRKLLEDHYAEHKGKKFFDPLLEYMQSGPIVALIIEGLEVIDAGRKMVGATNPLKAEPGTIRGDYAQATGRNLVHASDSVASAKREIGLWFGDEHLHWTPSWKAWTLEGEPAKGESLKH
jgi:nucleoside-diphosphate kinase